jgi:UDP-GlcNAc:undecaprenyl-phosphate/decaprenyl-phosphate GlcNAc-1-phosphate transferase
VDLSRHLAAFFIGLAVSAAITPLIRRLALHCNVCAYPAKDRWNNRAVPLLGGAAIAAGLAAGVGLTAPDQRMVPFLLYAGLMFLLGVFDDVRAVKPLPKLFGQMAVAAVALWLMPPVAVTGWAPIDRLVAFVWIVGVTNAFNLIDGVDGLAPGIGAIAGAACGAILIVRGHAPEAMLLAAFVGAMLGFLVYNFEPASIFLGDSGSLVTGFLLATTAIAGWQKGATALASAVPLLIFALPIADAGLTLLRRTLARPVVGGSLRTLALRIVEPDREHIHHRLLAMGWSVRYTVIVLYGVTALLSILALATAQVEP